MICNQCGQEIQEDSTFCVHCGAKLETEAPISYVPKKKGRVGLVALLVTVVVCIVLTVVFIVLGGSDKRKIQEQLDLGAKYLEELNYEQAILQYKLVLETDIQNKEALTKISEAYGLIAEAETEYTERIEAYDMAIEYALLACEYYPEDTTLQDMLVSTYMNAGEYCLENENLDDAEKYYTEGKEWAEKLSMTDKISLIDGKLAEIEQIRNEIEEAKAEQERIEKEKMLERRAAIENDLLMVEAILFNCEPFYSDSERNDVIRPCVGLLEEYRLLCEERDIYYTTNLLRIAYLSLGEYEMAKSMEKQLTELEGTDDTLSNDSYWNEEIRRDEYGRVVYTKDVDWDGQEWTSIYTYEGNFLISETRISQYPGEDAWADETNYSYDSEGRRCKMSTNLGFSHHYVYDENTFTVYFEDETEYYPMTLVEKVYDWNQLDTETAMNTMWYGGILLEQYPDPNLY